MMRIRAIAVMGLLVPAICLAAPLYKVVGKDGKVSFTDQPPTSGEAEAVKAPVNQARVVDVEHDPLAAAVAVYSKQLVVETAARFCMTFAPSTSHDVVVARDAWRTKNFALNDKKGKVMVARMSIEARNRLTEQSERENETVLARLRGAPAADKLKWCQNLPASFASQELDPSRSPILVRTIMDFKVP